MSHWCNHLSEGHEHQIGKGSLMEMDCTAVVGVLEAGVVVDCSQLAVPTFL